MLWLLGIAFLAILCVHAYFHYASLRLRQEQNRKHDVERKEDLERIENEEKPPAPNRYHPEEPPFDPSISFALKSLGNDYQWHAEFSAIVMWDKQKEDHYFLWEHSRPIYIRISPNTTRSVSFIEEKFFELGFQREDQSLVWKIKDDKNDKLLRLPLKHKDCVCEDGMDQDFDGEDFDDGA